MHCSQVREIWLCVCVSRWWPDWVIAVFLSIIWNPQTYKQVRVMFFFYFYTKINYVSNVLILQCLCLWLELEWLEVRYIIMWIGFLGLWVGFDLLDWYCGYLRSSSVLSVAPLQAWHLQKQYELCCWENRELSCCQGRRSWGDARWLTHAQWV